tara:strand:- start:2795 stop:7216 length:4422 start_codon:yes stop_codon:yes gene_type:complete
MSQEITTLTQNSGVDTPKAKIINAVEKIKEEELQGKDVVADENKIEEIKEERKDKSLKIQTNEEIQNAKVNPLDKPETEDTSWIQGVKNWYDAKVEENRLKNAEWTEQYMKNKKELQTSLVGKIIGGLIHGRIESVNELYNFGDDVLDLVMGDLYDSQRADDFDLIGFKEGHTNYGFKIGVREQYKEEADDGLLSAYGLSKTISQWIIPTGLLAKSLKKIGVKRFRYAIAGSITDAALTDPYDENFFNMIEDDLSLAHPILDFLTAPETGESEVEDRIRGRIMSLVQGLVVGEGVFGKGVPAVGRFGRSATKQFLTRTKSLREVFGIKSITDLTGKKGQEVVDYVIEQLYNMKRNGKRRTTIIAKINDTIKKNGADITQTEVDEIDANLIVSQVRYKKALQKDSGMQKYYKEIVGGDGKSLYGVPLKNSKITRTFNPHHLYKSVFKKDGQIVNKGAIWEYIAARSKVVAELNKKNKRSNKDLYLKAKTQLPLDVFDAAVDFVDKYGVEGEIDLPAVIITLNDMILESGIVLRDLSSQMHEMAKLTKGGVQKGDAYQILKNDLAFTLQFYSDLLNVKKGTGGILGSALQNINKTSADLVEGADTSVKGLKTYFEKSNQDKVLDDLANFEKSDDVLIDSMEDPLGEFTIAQILKAADDGNTKALMKLTRQLHLAATNPRAMKIILKAQQGNNVIKITNELFINSILSSPITHQVNMISTAFNTAMRPVMKIMGGGFELGEGLIKQDQALMADGSLTVKKAMMDLYYLTVASVESTIMAGKAFMHNANILDASNQTVDLSKLNAVDVSDKSWLIKGFHGLYTTPQRFLMAEDELFKQINFRAYVRTKIWERSLKKKFPTRKDYEDYVNGQFKKIIDVVNKESMTGKLSKQNAQLYKEARQFANEATFTEDLLNGTSGKFAQRLVNQNPILRQVIPFVRTPMNIMKQFMKTTPLAHILKDQPWAKNHLAFVREHSEEIMSKDPTIRGMAKGRMIVGNSFLTAGFLLSTAANDPLARVAITGGLPANKQQREKLLATGYLPYSFRFRATEEDIAKYGAEGKAYEVIQHPEHPDVKLVRGEDGKLAYRYVSYKRIEPYAMFLSSMADFTRVVGLMGEEAQIEKDGLYQVLMAAIYNNIGDKSYLRGITELFRVINNESTLNGFLMNRLATLAVPVSGLQKNVKTAINSGLFDEGKSGNIRMDKKVAKGEFLDDLGQPSNLNAPLIVFQRLLNEIANKTPWGNYKTRPMQHHITGEYLETPVGFGKGEMNPFTSGWSQKSMTNNDLVLSALNAVGFEFAPPTDVLVGKNKFSQGIYLNNNELQDLISATAFTELYYGGKRQRMYDAMMQVLKSPFGQLSLTQLSEYRGMKGEISMKDRREMARVTGNDWYITADFNDKMRVDLIDGVRKDLGKILSEIHTFYTKKAKEAYITGVGLPEGIDPLPEEKRKLYEENKKNLLLLEQGFNKTNTSENLKGFINY